VARRSWVVNASPLIFLDHINALFLLKELGDEVVVPFSVHKEVLAGAGKGPGSIPFKLPDWVSLQEDLPLLPEIAGWDLGAGESQVLAHAVLRDMAERPSPRSTNGTGLALAEANP